MSGGREREDPNPLMNFHRKMWARCGKMYALETKYDKMYGICGPGAFLQGGSPDGAPFQSDLEERRLQLRREKPTV